MIKLFLFLSILITTNTFAKEHRDADVLDQIPKEVIIQIIKKAENDFPSYKQ